MPQASAQEKKKIHAGLVSWMEYFPNIAQLVGIILVGRIQLGEVGMEVFAFALKQGTWILKTWSMLRKPRVNE
jgi:hypothetical protein